MAGEFLRSHGVDLDAEMARIQFGDSPQELQPVAGVQETDYSLDYSAQDESSNVLFNVSLPGAPGKTWDVTIKDGVVATISQHQPSAIQAAKIASSDQTPATRSALPKVPAVDEMETQLKSSRPAARTNFAIAINGHGALLAPSFCHPHVHLDKAFLLSHPKYADLQVEKGDFAEAMSLTSKAKAQFEEWDLLERGNRLVDESVQAGVTHMRAFVEVDAGVGRKCLDAGLKIQSERAGSHSSDGSKSCEIQLCAFAQLPLFTDSQDDKGGEHIRRLMLDASKTFGVDAIGSTPYVEGERRMMERNIEWMVDLAMERDLHLDFHLDYNLDSDTEPMIWHVIKTLKERRWKDLTHHKTVVLGHCTRLTLSSTSEWQRLAHEIDDLPISFVGLPTSDLFMMRTPNRTRGTLDVPRLIKDFGLHACLGINNIGNAFTPQGTCDPLTLACIGVGVYQAGTKEDAEVLFECVSTRAREAIGVGRRRVEDGGKDLEICVGDDADFVLFGKGREDWHTRRTVAEAVYLYDHQERRRGFAAGRSVQ